MATATDPGLYVGRRLLNDAALLAWVLARPEFVGYELDKHPHVTVAYSETDFEWHPEEGPVVATPVSLGILGEENAVVVFLESEELQSRWKELHESTGATWSYDDYQPHLTLFYLGEDADTSEFEDKDLPVPDFDFAFGEELGSPLDEDVFEDEDNGKIEKLLVEVAKYNLHKYPGGTPGGKGGQFAPRGASGGGAGSSVVRTSGGAGAGSDGTVVVGGQGTVNRALPSGKSGGEARAAFDSWAKDAATAAGLDGRNPMYAQQSIRSVSPQAHLTYFATDSHRAINQHLRTGVAARSKFSGSTLTFPVSGTSRRTNVQAITKIMDGEFKSSPFTLPKGQELLRGVSTDFASKLTVGSSFIDKGFVSTTNNRAQTKNTRGYAGGRATLVIKLKQNTKVLVHTREQEILLPRNTRFKVLSKNKKQIVLEADTETSFGKSEETELSIGSANRFVWSLPEEDEEMLIDVEKQMPIVKVDSDQQMVWGWANVCVIGKHSVEDSQKDVIDTYDIQKAAHQFMKDSRTGGSMHMIMGIGEVVESLVFTKEIQKALDIDLGLEGWFIGVHVTDKKTWAKVKDGTFKAFSIGGLGNRIEIDEEEAVAKGYYEAGPSSWLDYNGGSKTARGNLKHPAAKKALETALSTLQGKTNK